MARAAGRRPAATGSPCAMRRRDQAEGGLVEASFEAHHVPECYARRLPSGRDKLKEIFFPIFAALRSWAQMGEVARLAGRHSP